MSEHPIEGLMLTAMSSIKDMIDVNTIIGDPIETSNNTVIIPISKVSFGFASGGSEFKGETIDEYTKKEKEEAIQYRLPFGGGSGAGASVNPIAFIIIQENNVKLMPFTHTSAFDKFVDYIPEILEKANNIVTSSFNHKNSKDMVDDYKKSKKEIIKDLEESKKKIEKNIDKDVKDINNIEKAVYEFEYNDVEDE